MDKFIGLEISRQSITFVKLLLTNKRWHLLKCGRVRINPEGPDVSNKVSVLKYLFKEVNLLDTKIISIVSDPCVLVRDFIFPLMGNKELLEAAKWKVKEYLTFSLEEAIIDIRVVEKTGEGQQKRCRVSVVAIPRDVIIQQTDILKAAGIMPHVVTIAPLAFEGLFSYSIALHKDETIITLNIEADLTSVSIYRKGKLELARMVNSNLDRLPLDIRLSLDYFMEESHGGRVEKMVIFGEQAELQEIIDILRGQLPLSVETINPLQDAAISYTSASLRYDDGLISGQQISIPLGAVLNCGGGINMLPNEIKRQTRDYLLGAGARFVSILGSFIFLFVYLNFGFNIEGYKERLAAANSEAESLKLLVKEIEPLENLQEAVSNRLNLLQSLLGRRKVWSLILRELGRLLPEDITLDSLTVSETAVTIKGVVSSAKQPPENILSVFITSLEKGIFRDVALISTQKNEEQRTLDFSLSSKLDY